MQITMQCIFTSALGHQRTWSSIAGMSASYAEAVVVGPETGIDFLTSAIAGKADVSVRRGDVCS